jgi:MoaA/NifB/PqqE/SkfB family radical SAM enzyme
MKKLQVEVDKNGKLSFSEEFNRQYGLKPGARVVVDETAKGPRLRLPLTHLKKVYIEPTNRCNLDCRICMRHAWDEPLGQMSRETFARIIENLREFSPPPTVFFGALGEPLAHPDILDMVTQAKALGSPVELITNGTLLTPDMSKNLIEARLDVLWASLDGVTPESYGDIRLGALLPEVLANLKIFRQAGVFDPFSSRSSGFHVKPEIGIVFVAMKRNIQELPALMNLAMRLGATRVLVTNVLPYTEEMGAEVLYSRSLTDAVYQSSVFRLQLPKMDIDDGTKKSLFLSMQTRHSVSFVRSPFTEGNDYCPFVEEGTTAIGWEGSLSPCLSLLHSHRYYFEGIERCCRRYTIGNVHEHSIRELWDNPEYLKFRERVQAFEFAPCTYCGGCALLADNEKDCIGNSFPACGGCLWAQGVVQCP